MPYRDAGFWGFIADWWGFLAFLGAGAVAFLAGKERQRYRVDQIGKDVEILAKRVKALEVQGNAEAVTLGEIKVMLSQIVQALGEVRADLKGKADKK
jgi:phage-related minor tail protein